MGKHWSGTEIATLRRMYPSYPKRSVQKAIPRMSYAEIAEQAKIQELVHHPQNPRTGSVTWPGMEFGRFAYGMTEEEIRSPPKKTPKDMSTTTHPAMAELKNFFLDRIHN